MSVFVTVFFSSAPLAYAVEPPLETRVKSPSPIVVIRGPNGLTITSDDLEALDEFQRMLATTVEGLGNGPLAVFYLKNAKAQAIAEELETILAGGGSYDADGSSKPGSDASQRRTLATGSIKITPEPRLNALMVLASPADQNMVKGLLKILDLNDSPEVTAVSPKPRMIPVVHARAKDIADVLRQVYADQLVVAPSQVLQGPWGNLPFPIDVGLFGAVPGGGGPDGSLNGGFDSGNGGGDRGGSGGGVQNNRATPANRISISVDTHTNNLIVAATDPVFQEVKQLVRQLDAAKAEQHEIVQMVTLHHGSAATVQRALTAIAGDAVQTTSSNPNSLAANRRGNTTSSGPPSAFGGFGRVSGEQRFRDGDGLDWSRFSPPGGPGQ